MKAMAAGCTLNSGCVIGMSCHILVSCQCVLQSGEQAWAYSPKVIRTNEIARLVIVMYHFPYNSKFLNLYSSICTFFEQVWRKRF